MNDSLPSILVVHTLIGSIPHRDNGVLTHLIGTFRFVLESQDKGMIQVGLHLDGFTRSHVTEFHSLARSRIYPIHHYLLSASIDHLHI